MGRYAKIEGDDVASTEPTASATRAARAMPPVPPEETEGWAETVWRHGAPPGARLRWLAPRLPVLRRADRLESLRSPYVTCWGREDADAVLRSGARLHHLDALPGTAVPRLMRGYRRAGWAADLYRSFGVWHDDLSAGWPTFWAARPTRLRETVRRKRGRFGAPRRVCGDAAAAAHRAVAAEAWQGAEPFPRFVEAAIRRGGEEGWLRAYQLGTDAEGGAEGGAKGGDAPAALQLWLVGAGWASLAKTWHRRAEQGASPGTILTAAVLERLAGEGVRGFDLGRGDDPYKADWARFRAQRWGVVAAPLASPRGLAIAARVTAKTLLGRN